MNSTAATLQVVLQGRPESLLKSLAVSGQGVQQLVSRLTGLNGELQRLGAQLLSAFSIGAITRFTMAAIDLAEQLHQLSQETGLAVEQLDSLRLLGIRNQISFDQLRVGLANFNNQLAQAQIKGGEASAVFDRLGVSVFDAGHRARNTAEVLREAAAALARFQGQERSALARELFGRGGERWIPSLLEYSALQTNLGGITTEMARSANEFNNRLAELRESANRLFLTLANDLLPQMERFVLWLLEIEKKSNSAGGAALTLSGYVKGLAVALRLLWQILDSIGSYIGTSLAYAFESFNDGLNVAIKLCELWHRALLEIYDALRELARRALAFGEVLALAMSGRITQAAVILRLRLEEVGDKLEARAKALQSVVVQSADVLTGFLGRQGARVLEFYSGIFAQLKKQWLDFWNWALSLWMPALKPKVGRPLESEPAKLGEPAPPIITEAGRKMLADLQKRYDEEFLSRVQYLEKLREAELESLKKELGDTEAFLKAKAMLFQLYDRRISEEERKLADARNAQSLAALQSARRAIETDPYLTRAEKQEALNALYQNEYQLLNEIVALNERRLSDPREEVRIEAERNLVALRREQVELMRQQAELNDSLSFTGTMQRGLVELRDAWGNLGANLGTTFLDGVKTAVQGVTDAIMGAIEGTKTWGQVFLQVGRQILASIINVVVNFIVQMTVLAALQKLFNAIGLKTAASAASGMSVAWSPAAMARSIAELGPIAGPTVFAAQMAASVGIGAAAGAAGATTGLSTGLAGRAGGGLVERGIPYIVGEKGPELFVPRESGFILPQVPAWAYHAPAAAAPGGAYHAQPVINDNRIKIGIFDDKSRLRDFWRSEEGRGIFVDLLRQHAHEVGLA